MLNLSARSAANYFEHVPYNFISDPPEVPSKWSSFHLKNNFERYFWFDYSFEFLITLVLSTTTRPVFSGETFEGDISSAKVEGGHWRNKLNMGDMTPETYLKSPLRKSP